MSLMVHLIKLLNLNNPPPPLTESSSLCDNSVFKLQQALREAFEPETFYCVQLHQTFKDI